MIRIANNTDVKQIFMCQSNTYSDNFIESEIVIENIINHNLSLVYELNNKIIAYLLGHHSIKNHIYKLNNIHNIDKIDNIDNTDKSDLIYYIHDLCILKEYQKQNIGTQMVEYLYKSNNNHFNKNCLFKEIMGYQLISLEHAVKFWQRMGFTISRTIILSDSMKQAYGDKSEFMESILKKN